MTIRPATIEGREQALHEQAFQKVWLLGRAQPQEVVFACTSASPRRPSTGNQTATSMTKTEATNTSFQDELEPELLNIYPEATDGKHKDQTLSDKSNWNGSVLKNLSKRAQCAFDVFFLFQ
jgi:hypothetical protein